MKHGFPSGRPTGGVGLVTLLGSSVSIVGMGCVHHHHPGPSVPAARAKAHGPPPHAPAHGYRHKHRHHGVDLVFDSGLGVYLVLGQDAHYFHGDRFFRLSGGVWQVSGELGSGWATIAVGNLPAGLQRAEKHKKHHRGHGPPARRGR